MRHRAVMAVLSALAVGGVTLAFSGLAACPLSHDAVETDRACWDKSDCVQNERCSKPDGGELGLGTCAVPTDGPCGADAGFGFYCFENEQSQPESCFYEPRDRCKVCGLDGGLPDSGCPEPSCLQWQDRWGCR